LTLVPRSCPGEADRAGTAPAGEVASGPGSGTPSGGGSRLVQSPRATDRRHRDQLLRPRGAAPPAAAYGNRVGSCGTTSSTLGASSTTAGGTFRPAWACGSSRTGCATG